jgi:HEAT repeat protein
VPPLLSILDKRDRASEEERVVAVEALGRIGDERAIKPLIDHFSAPYESMAMYSIKGTREFALRSLTGEQNVVGGKEWAKWYEMRCNSSLNRNP